MIKRVTWFLSGLVTGAAGLGVGKRSLKRGASRLPPVRLVRKATGAVRGRGHVVRDAWNEGRSAMRAREAELRGAGDAHVESLEGRLEPGDRVLVDGRPVDLDRIVVVRPGAERRRADLRRRHRRLPRRAT